MPDLNDLRVFERVGSLRSFAAAARSLSQPRSTISRCVARLEAQLGTRLIQRTTREVALTPSGEALMARCSAALSQIDEAMTYVGGFSSEPKGLLRISCGIGFGINVLAEQLPEFLRRFPAVDVFLDLSSQNADLVGDRVDIAVRIAPMPDSSLVAVRLGEMDRLLCAAPDYLARRGTPQTPADLAGHDVIEIPRSDGRQRVWSFTKDGATSQVSVEQRMQVNDALTIHRLVLNGAGIAIISAYLCTPEFRSGRLVHLLPTWSAPPVPVSLVFPSRRELSPVVRAFVAFMKEANPPGIGWRNNDP